MGRLIGLLCILLTSCAAIPPSILAKTGEILIEFCELEANKYHSHCLIHEETKLK